MPGLQRKAAFVEQRPQTRLRCQWVRQVSDRRRAEPEQDFPAQPKRLSASHLRCNLTDIGCNRDRRHHFHRGRDFDTGKSDFRSGNNAWRDGRHSDNGIRYRRGGNNAGGGLRINRRLNHLKLLRRRCGDRVCFDGACFDGADFLRFNDRRVVGKRLIQNGYRHGFNQCIDWAFGDHRLRQYRLQDLRSLGIDNRFHWHRSLDGQGSVRFERLCDFSFDTCQIFKWQTTTFQDHFGLDRWQGGFFRPRQRWQAVDQRGNMQGNRNAQNSRPDVPRDIPLPVLVIGDNGQGAPASTVISVRRFTPPAFNLSASAEMASILVRLSTEPPCGACRIAELQEMGPGRRKPELHRRTRQSLPCPAQDCLPVCRCHRSVAFPPSRILQARAAAAFRIPVETAATGTPR